MTVSFKMVPDYPGYRVGDDGSVWSKWKRGSYRSTEFGDWRRLSPAATERGRRFVGLYRNGKRSHVYIAPLVLTLFTGPRPDGLECCHWDGDPSNNSLSNLRWDTRSANHMDKRRHGTSGRKLVGREHDVIRMLRSMSERAVAERFGVGRYVIRRIRKEPRVSLSS